jgi:hypothetical protein
MIGSVPPVMSWRAQGWNEKAARECQRLCVCVLMSFLCERCVLSSIVSLEPVHLCFFLFEFGRELNIFAPWVFQAAQA